MDLPSAPTPPGNGNGNGMLSNSDRTANLLNLLKFSGENAHQQRQQQQQQQQQHNAFGNQPVHHHGESDEAPHAQHYSHGQHLAQSRHHHEPQTPESYVPVESHDQPVPSLPHHHYPTQIHQPAPASADPTGLLAALMKGAHETEESPKAAPDHSSQASAAAAAQQVNAFSGGSPSAGTRSYLLNLLNRPKPSQTEQPMLTEASRSDNFASRSSDGQSRDYGSEDAYAAAQRYQQLHTRQQQQHQQHQPANSAFSLATSHDSSQDSALYHQLLGSLNQASSNHSSQAPHSQILKQVLSPAGSQSHRGHQDSPVTSPHRAETAAHRPASRQSHLSHHSQPSLKHSSPALRHRHTPTETVSEAMDDLAGKASHDAAAAIARAEINVEDKQVVDAAREVEEQVNMVEKALESDPKFDNKERDLIKDIQQSVQGIIDEVNGDAVADSWESADQEEIVVIEEKETPPVKVFNFPMKPWISINFQDETSITRPEFHPDSIMDIARLKKDFDQMDRNLYTATQSYMTYGMSKQGGLRVIRQDDGKDAKVFTDTKDRIFNLSMSTTPTGHNGISKEAIIGTGVSGTVYWVQIKEGSKDHIDDSQLEQYGFALPPATSQDGDAPGGVLKTRARASTAHPEYFAVGRGKFINIIWPSYIMQHNLLKPGHDRLVDVAALQKHASLKINTGKAGKDFTFSQDDTVVVSLDKSGRVKFWDVRDLTAAKEGSSPHAPTPAHTSFEVKEPLMTLASTREGEKAWPTSVMLLDKQRPYQKQCALRYMIVGMKQNHTLQLWDLALGKPVQEFNLPHSKESDAVCSVMYHPASGMIVIGHPTRNSIYFAHLSAPKYNLKSVSQAEYVQRLASSDSSISPPESTAVISGVREYSFASRGMLRSLDILPDAAMLQESGEPALFELYAMHSKGVACLMIKQAELGWDKDNKVVDPADAVTEGLVTISKLKAPPVVEQGNGDSRASSYKLVKDSAIADPAPPLVDELSTPRSAEPATTKTKPEPQEAEPASFRDQAAEKPERKSRKKKAAASNSQPEPPSQPGTSRAASVKDSASDKVSPGFSNEMVQTALAGVERRLGDTVNDSVGNALRSMQVKLDQGAHAREVAHEESQKQLLGMVSEVLNDNVQSVLGSLVNTQITEHVMPVIGDRASRAVSDVFDKRMQSHITSAVQKEVHESLHKSLGHALRSKDVTNSIADRIGDSVTGRVQQEMLVFMSQQLTPAVSNIVTQTTQGYLGEMHQSYREQFEQMSSQHIADMRKIDQLLSYVTRLTEMVGTMAQTQSTMQADFVRFQQHQPQPPVQELPVPASSGGQAMLGASSHQRAGHNGYQNSMTHSQAGSYNGSQVPAQSAHTGQYLGSPQFSRGHQAMSGSRGSLPSEQVGAGGSLGGFPGGYPQQTAKEDPQADQRLREQVQHIEQLLHEGRLQDAMLHWIQSGQEEAIFKTCLSRYPPEKFQDLPMIMLLVVVATVSKNVRPNRHLREEIDWISMALGAFRDDMVNLRDVDPSQDFNEIVRSTTQTLQLLDQRMKPLLAGYQGDYPIDPFLGKVDRGAIDGIMQTSKQIMDTLARQLE